MPVDCNSLSRVLTISCRSKVTHKHYIHFCVCVKVGTVVGSKPKANQIVVVALGRLHFSY